MKQLIEIPYDIRTDKDRIEERDKLLDPWDKRFNTELFRFYSLCENELIYSTDDCTWKIHIYKPNYDDYYTPYMSIKELLTTYAERISLIEYGYDE